MLICYSIVCSATICYPASYLTMTIQEKLKKLRDELKQMFLERSDLIDGALAALLSAHHLLIIGPPGTAKSMLADELCRRIDGANYFQWLLTRFTTPEEIFRRGKSQGSGTGRLPARHQPQTSRSPYRLSR